MKIYLSIAAILVFYSSITLYSQKSSVEYPQYLSRGNQHSLMKMNHSYNFQSEFADSPLVNFTPNFSNPVEIGIQDSLDISITISNQSTAPFPWLAYITPLTTGDKMETSRWPLQYVSQLSGNDNTGIEFDGSFFYITHAFSPYIDKYDPSGVLIESFTIPGINNLREITYDGMHMYGVSGGPVIYQMDFVTMQLIGTLPCSITPRHIAYDSGEDGFWIGGWNTDLFLIDRSGSILSTLSLSMLGMSTIGGSAYDNQSQGGPYLWIFGEPPGGGQPTYLTQISLVSGAITGISYNVADDFSSSNPAAGGLFSTSAFISGTISLGGILKGTPEYSFAYNISDYESPWLRLLVHHGSVSPSSNTDILLRVYGFPYDTDSLQVNFPTDDPLTPLVSLPVIRRVVLSEIEPNQTISRHFRLYQNYPNPFNPETTISYELLAVSFVTLKVFDVSGQAIATLVSERKLPGKYIVEWDAKQHASGIYYYSLQSGKNRDIKKMILVK